MAATARRKKAVKKRRHYVTSQKTEKQPSAPPLPVVAREDQIVGKYCNLAIIRHTNREFVLDFISAVDVQRVLVSRIITSPEHAKELHKVLGANIQRYEKKFKQIPLE